MWDLVYCGGNKLKFMINIVSIVRYEGVGNRL